MTAVKKVSAIIALLAMAVFIAATVTLLLTGHIAVRSAWVYVPMTVFLFFGVLSIIIDRMQKRAEEARKQAEETETGN